MTKSILIKISFFITWCFGIHLHSQNLKLSIYDASGKESKTIDSLGYETNFDNLQMLKSEVSTLQKRLENIGYIESQIISEEKTSDTTFVVNFSLKERYTKIYIYNKDMVSTEILKSINAKIEDDYFTIAVSDLEISLNRINSVMANKGDPFFKLQLTNITKNTDYTLNAELTTSSAPSRTIDNIFVKGYQKFPKSYLKHFLKIKRGQPFNLKAITEKTAELDNLQFANIIRDPEVLFTNDSTILYMYIEKNRSNTFDGFLGFGTNETTNKIEFDGYLDLSLTNNLNYGESLRLLYKSDENDQQTFDLDLLMPFLFNTPLGVDLNLNIFKRDSTFSTVIQQAKLNFQINSKSKIAVGIDAETSTNLLDTEASKISDYTANNYFSNYQYLKRQNKNVLFPINFLFNLTAGLGDRTYLNTTDDQYDFRLNTYKIFNFNNQNSLFARISGQYLISNTYLENELPRFGGINSIRGFEENSLLANLYGVLNTEYRYQLNNSLYIHSVIDAAYFENQITDQREKLFGFGFGFGLVSNAGLLKFNYTSGKTENQKFRLSDSKIHISLTAVF